MEYSRREILPNVYLTCLRTDKFKTGLMSATLLTQLQRQTAAENALLPYVLRRGTASAPDMAALQARLDGLYGASAEPCVRRKGEIQCVGFRAGFGEDRFLPGSPSVTESAARLLGELWLAPNTRGGLFLPAYADGERAKLVERIDALINDKVSYAVTRLIECMCPCEDFGVRPLGTRDTAENIYYVNLSRHYRTLLAVSPVELFYCGAQEPARIEETFRQVFLALPRGEPERDLGTDVRMNTVEEAPRHFTEELDVTQGKLAVGFRLGECMEDPDPAVLRVLNAVYGGGVSSKLFANVRERLSLCYYANSFCELHKGVMIAHAGIDFDRYDAALSEILAQLEALRAGELTAEELEGAKRYVASSLRGVSDSPAALEDFWLDQCVDGLEYGPDELAALVEGVTAEQVVAAAQGIRCDAVYFLRGAQGGQA